MTSFKLPPALIDGDTTASLLGISVRALRRYAADGSVPSVKIGRRFRYDPVAITALMASGFKPVAQND